ncbi:MAG: XRE family transcriptional regulator [Candidatus Hydrogenedentota bacterium]|nr:MAG: XRE family transcriptional regulator [Candidatus Hydrogenedentota bacterium]
MTWSSRQEYDIYSAMHFHEFQILVGNRVKDLRMQRRLTQEKVEEICRGAITVRTLQRIEAGEANMRLSTLFALARALEVHPHIILRV